MDIGTLINYLKHQRLVRDYLYMATGALLVYDYILTFHLEVKLIWFSQWSYTKVLFLFIRYLTFVGVFIAICGETLPDIPLNVCGVIRPMEAWLVMLMMLFAESVLAIRTWAVWGLNKFVGAGLLSVTAAHLIIQCVWLNTYIHSIQYAPGPYPGFRGCLITRVDRNLWKEFVLLTTVELIVFVLMAINAFRTYKISKTNRLWAVIHRDGIMFYVYLLGVTIASVVITIVLPIDLVNLLSPPEAGLYSVFTTRIVLNIRDIGVQGLHVGLHTGHDDSSPPSIPLEFYHNAESSTAGMSSQGATTSGTDSV